MTKQQYIREYIRVFKATCLHADWPYDERSARKYAYKGSKVYVNAYRKGKA